jgi:hypothetical protein
MDLLKFQSLIGIKERSKRHCNHETSFQSLIGIKKRPNMLLVSHRNMKILIFGNNP